MNSTLPLLPFSCLFTHILGKAISSIKKRVHTDRISNIVLVIYFSVTPFLHSVHNLCTSVFPIQFSLLLLLPKYCMLLSLTNLPLGLCPGRLFAQKGHDRRHHRLHQGRGAAIRLDLCHVLLIERLQSLCVKRGRKRMRNGKTFVDVGR